MKEKSIKINAILSMIKQICAIIFPLITIPYVSRILQAENYGKINFSNSIISYFLLIANLGISSYAIREGARIRENRKHFKQFSSEIFSINMIATIVSYLLLAICIVCSAKLKKYILLLEIQSASIILTTIGADWINSVYEDYLYITIRYIIIQFFSMLALFLFVRKPEDYIVYAVIYVLSTTGGNIFNIFYIKKYTRLVFTLQINWKKHFKPILTLFFNALASTIYVSSDTTILGYMKGEKVVGIYSLAAKIYLSIKQILNALILVSMPRLSAYLGTKEYERYNLLAKKIVNVLFTLILPCVIGLFVLSDDIILLVGGTGYIGGGIALKLLGIALGFAVIAGFYCCAVIIPYRLEKVCVIASSTSAVINIVLNFILIPKFGFIGAAFTTLLSEAVACIIYMKESLKIVKVFVSIKVLLSNFIGAIGIYVICSLVKNVLVINYQRVGVSMVFSGLLYYVIQMLFGNIIVQEMTESFIDKFRSRNKR